MVHLVFDFDWSLVNENIDRIVFRRLAPVVHKYLEEQAGIRRGQWTNIVDEALVLLQKDHNTSLEQIKAVMQELPTLNQVVESIELVHSQGGDCFIVSDANEFFINSFLESRNLSKFISRVETNRSYFDEQGYLRVTAHTPDPHGCKLCPPNMCKGKILGDLGLLNSKSMIIYVGDGNGDFCASVKLRKGDLLLVRDDVDYPSARGLVTRIKEEKEIEVQADINYWKSGADVYETIDRKLRSLFK